MYIKIFCTSNKAFWSVTLGKFLQKQIIINTTIKWNNAFFFETTNLKAILCRKYHYPLWKPAEYGWISPIHNRVFLFRAMVLLLKGPRCMFISKIAAYPSETLIRSSGGPSVKKGVSNSIPVTQALRSRGTQGRQQSLSLSPPPQVCNQNVLIPLNF